MLRRELLKSVALLPILPELIMAKEVNPILFVLEMHPNKYECIEYNPKTKYVKKLRDAIDWVESNEIDCKYRYVLCLSNYYLGLVSDEPLNQKITDYWFAEMKRDRYKRDKAWAHEIEVNV